LILAKRQENTFSCFLRPIHQLQVSVLWVKRLTTSYLIYKYITIMLMYKYIRMQKLAINEI
jgi:hypothetical protein